MASANVHWETADAIFTLLNRFFLPNMLLLSDHADLGFQSKIYSFFEGHFVKDGTSKERELKYRFLLYGYSGLIGNWAKSGMKEAPEEMAGYINALRHEMIRTKS